MWHVMRGGHVHAPVAEHDPDRFGRPRVGIAECLFHVGGIFGRQRFGIGMRTKAEKLAKGVKPGSVDLDKKPKPSDTKGGDSKKMAGKLFGPKAD